MPTDNEQVDLTDDDFYTKYHPEFNQVLMASRKHGQNNEDMCSYDGCMYETFGPELDYVLKMDKVNPKRVWTIIDDNSGWTGICAGYHLVNRIGYLVTEEEWQEDNESYTVFDETDELQVFHDFNMEELNIVFKRELPTNIERDDFEEDNLDVIYELHDEWYDMEYEEKHRILTWWREKREYENNGKLFPPDDLKFAVKAFWGEEKVLEIEDIPDNELFNYPENGDDVVVYKFATMAELEAFMKGVQACFGWQKYQIVEL